MIKEIRVGLQSSDSLVRKEALVQLIRTEDATSMIKKLLLKEIMTSDPDQKIRSEAAKFYEMLFGEPQENNRSINIADDFPEDSSEDPFADKDFQTLAEEFENELPDSEDEDSEEQEETDVDEKTDRSADAEIENYAEPASDFPEVSSEEEPLFKNHDFTDDNEVSTEKFITEEHHESLQKSDSVLHESNFCASDFEETDNLPRLEIPAEEKLADTDRVITVTGEIPFDKLSSPEKIKLISEKALPDEILGSVIRTEKDPNVLEKIIFYIRQQNLTGYASAVARFIRHKDHEIRNIALETVESLQIEKTFNIFVIGLLDEHTSVRETAEQCLKKLGKEKTLDLLFTMMYSSKRHDQIAAAYLLSRMNSRESLKLLNRSLFRKTEV